jgi:hypothetical protein
MCELGRTVGLMGETAGWMAVDLEFDSWTCHIMHVLAASVVCLVVSMLASGTQVRGFKPG